VSIKKNRLIHQFWNCR